MRSYLLFLLLPLLLSSCRKNKEAGTEISGTITNLHNGQGVSGIVVYLEAQEIQNGNFNSSWRSVDEALSNSNGSYSLNFDKKNVVEYRIRYEAPNYFSQEIFVNPDDVKVGVNLVRNISIAGMSWMKVNVKNTNPVNNQDLFAYNISAGHLSCPDPCCNSDQKMFIGMNIDTSIVCLAESDHLIYLNGESIKNGQSNPYSANGYLPLGDTLVINANY
jgi:5-hydroxyisourate hydrolase-like protein (transthyretin family)